METTFIFVLILYHNAIFNAGLVMFIGLHTFYTVALYFLQQPAALIRA